MIQFYTTQIDEEIALLSVSESQHLKVVRKNIGDEIQIVDGRGKAYLGEIQNIQKKGSRIKIKEIIRQTEAPPKLAIAIAPTKQNDRYEWFLEKATEIGVQEVYPFTSYHSERKMIKVERMEKIILSAMKQSLRLWLPRLHPIQTLQHLIQSKSFNNYDKFIPNTICQTPHLKEVIDPSHETIVVIGPEGGYSEMEIDDSTKWGFSSVTLGEARLRTETAGIVVCSLFANS